MCNSYPKKIIYRYPNYDADEINKKPTKNYSDDEIDEIFSDEEKKVEKTFINQQNKKVTEKLERFEIHITRKYLDFKIKNFNSINNQNF